GGEVLGELTTDRAGRDDIDVGDETLDLASDVGGVPARALRAEAGDGDLDDGVAVELRDRHARQRGGGVRGGIAEVGELLVPAAGKVGAVEGGDLVWARLRPGAAVPGYAQLRS